MHPTLLLLLLTVAACHMEAPTKMRWQQEFLNRVNTARAKGCRCGARTMPPAPALSWNEALNDAARRHVRDMARNKHFDHTGTDGSTIGQRAKAAGYNWRAIAENIAWGYQDPVAVVEGWLKSPGHCRNLMNPNYKDMGAAVEASYWVQTLGNK